jgi:adenine-specific DNA-methyltransferase
VNPGQRPYGQGVIKYLGSKRTLVPVLGEIAARVEARTAVDLFTGTTRVAQELKRRGITVTAADLATYSQVLSDCYVATDARDIDGRELQAEIDRLMALPGEPGYFTDTFCVASRFFQPRNGARVDAIRDAIEADHRGSPLHPILLTSLMLAADRVDSTTGVQMAYLKQWAPRAYNELEMRVPQLLPGPGVTVGGDALETVDLLEPVDLMYVDPPYNQHRYFTNYHVWETLVRWDAPEHYGVACKRVDSRDDATKSVFNSRRTMPLALSDLLERARAEVVVVSYNDESWITAEEMVRSLRDAGHQDVRMLAFDSKRYVGAQIGIFNPSGEKVGTVSRLRNVEYLFVAGPTDKVDAAMGAAAAFGALSTASRSGDVLIAPNDITGASSLRPSARR